MVSANLYGGLGAVPQWCPGPPGAKLSPGQGQNTPEAGEVFITQSLMFDVPYIIHTILSSFTKI